MLLVITIWDLMYVPVMRDTPEMGQPAMVCEFIQMKVDITSRCIYVTTSLYSCTGVFKDRVIFRLILSRNQTFLANHKSCMKNYCPRD